MKCVTAKHVKKLMGQRYFPGGVVIERGGFAAEERELRASCASI